MMDQELLGEVSKGGVEQFQFHVRRGNNGLILLTKVHPDIEAFMRGLGSGEVWPVSKWSRDWRKISGEGDELLAYDLGPKVGLQQYGTGQHYCLDRVGGMPWEQRTIAVAGRSVALDRVVNLSFLRLQGISTQGIAFAFGGVYKSDEALSFIEDIKAAARSFYLNFLKPVNVIVTLSTQEVK
jgi:hypothetical protein